MIIRLKVFEQTLSIVDTKSVPRQGSKDYLVLHFLFSSDWKDLDKLCYLQHGDVSQPIDVVDGLVEVPEWFTQQDSFDVTLFGKSGTQEVPTNVVSLRLEKSSVLWEQNAPEPQPSWLAKVIDLNNHPPIPGGNGHWLLWDTESGAYVESELPLPDISVGPQGPKGDKGDTGPQGPQGEQGPAGVADISLSVTGATVGQIAKITAVDDTGKPTAWSPVDMASGGGGREWAMLGEIDISAVGGGDIELTNLDNFTEFYATWKTVINESTTDSGYNLLINDVKIANTAIPIKKTGSSSNYGWMIARYNGIVWEIQRSSGSIEAVIVSLSNINSNLPYNLFLGVGKATKFKLSSPVPKYQAVSGAINIYGR